METTLNIRTDILAKINRIADKYGVSRSEVILFFINKVMREVANPENIGKMVKYQEKSSQGDWHTFHLKLRMDDYEYLLDLRKLLKMSVSLILAIAVEKYFEKKNKLIVADNYRYKNYIIAKEVIENTICWKFIWGYPRHLEKILNF